MGIKCGACKGRHESVAEVRECSGVRPVAGGEAERYLRNQESLTDGERDSRVWLADVADGRATMEEYVAARDDLSPEQKARGLESFNRIPVRTERMATDKMGKYVRDIIAQRVVPPMLAEEVEEALLNDRLSFRAARQFIDDYKDAPRKPREQRSDMAGINRESVTATRVGSILDSGAQPERVDLVDGIYRNPADGSIRKVYHTVHGANEQVAKRLNVLEETERFTKVVRGKEVEVKAEFVYEGKRGLAGLTPEMRMTLEDAKKYGAIYGVCIRCSATLTLEESIERAMGSTCASKANWA